MEASSHCRGSPNLKSPFTLRTVAEREEIQPDSDLNNEHVMAMDFRSREMKAMLQQKDHFFLTSPNEETDEDETQHSVYSCFSRCSNEKELFLNCYPGREEDEQPSLSSDDTGKSPSSLSSEEEEAQHDSVLDNDHVVILNHRSQVIVTKAKPKQKDIFFSPNEEIEDDDESKVFHSVKSCFSHCPSEKESLVNCLKKFHTGSLWEHIRRCEGWPFGLYRRALMVPPLPNSPSDSWTWHRSTHGHLRSSKTVVIRK